jgi:hypothetical protein
LADGEVDIFFKNDKGETNKLTFFWTGVDIRENGQMKVRMLTAASSQKQARRIHPAGGETVLVTDRDRVVAELGPPARGRSPLVSDALLLDAVRQGWIRPTLLAGGEMPARKPVMKLREILADLQEDRSDR